MLAQTHHNDPGVRVIHSDDVNRDPTVLRSVPAFGGLTLDTLGFLLDRAVQTTVAKGDYFFEQGDSGDAVYILDTGRVAVEKKLGEHRYLLRILEAGDCFGEIALLSITKRTASIRALEPCEGLRITNRHLRDLYEHDLEQFTLLVMNLGREVCRRFEEIDRRLFAFVGPTLKPLETDD